MKSPINRLLTMPYNFAFDSNFGRLGATYAVHLRRIGKLLVDFLLVIIELFHWVLLFCHNHAFLTNGGRGGSMIAIYRVVALCTMQHGKMN